MRRRAYLLWRVLFFCAGIALFYAPAALVTRVALAAFDIPLEADAHRICLRMPFEWALQPWMYEVMLQQPTYLVAPVVLPLVAFFLGPLFCGWLCPAGTFPDLLSRVVPERLKLSLGGRLDPAPIRYGVLAGMMVSPFLGGYVCCTFCNFTMMQNVVSLATGDPTGMVAWASFTIVTFVLWLVVLGLLLKGGRGWCNLLCPAGAVQGLFHALGVRLGLSRRVTVDSQACEGCGRCVEQCAAWAISQPGKVNPHACNACLECQTVCPRQAIRYRLRPAARATGLWKRES